MPLTDSEKEWIVSEALKTDEGRAGLSESMVEPIRDHIGPYRFSFSVPKETKIYKIEKYEDIVSDISNRFKILDL
jgi:hypothetical protein